MTFETLRLNEPLMRAVHAAGYTEPTPIQRDAIPHVLTGRDVLGCAQTGTGKTAAFALPILQRLMQTAPQGAGDYRPIGARALVLCPTRELAVQIHESFVMLGQFTNLRCVGVFGGVHQGEQVRGIQAGVDVLIATPGRLLDLFDQRLARLTLVETVVLDEADRMLDIGFLPAIRRILAHIPEDRQTLMFSATMPPEIRKLAKEILRDPAHVAVTPISSAVPTVEHWVHFVHPEEKPHLLARLLEDLGDARSLVFTRTKHGAEKLVRHLRRAGVRAAAMHGDKSQADRLRVLGNFRSAHTPVLVATDIAARGLHIDEVSHVFNYDVTREPETYVHRIGRTGRAGAAGTAVTFCTAAEHKALKAVERLINAPIKRAEPPGVHVRMTAGDGRDVRRDERAGEARGGVAVAVGGGAGGEQRARTRSRRGGRRRSERPAGAGEAPRAESRVYAAEPHPVFD